MQEKGTVKHYSARLELPNHLFIDLSGDDFPLLKESVNRILGGGARFDPPAAVAGTTVQIFHPSYDNGKTEVGWCVTAELPAHMSNRSIVERRLQQAA